MNPKKQIYKVRTTWQMEGELEVKAWNEEDALYKAEGMDRPQTGTYIDGSHQASEAYLPEQPVQIPSADSESKPERDRVDSDLRIGPGMSNADNSKAKEILKILDTIYPKDNAKF